LLYQAIQSNDVSNQQSVADWETYRNEQYGFEFKYPFEWSLTDLYNNLSLKNVDGEEVVQIGFSGRSLNSDYQNTLENYIKSTAGQENSRSGEDMPENIEELSFEKIINTKETLGYLSQWKITWADKISENETRADFESKLEINQTDNYKIVISFFVLKTEQNLNNIDLLKSIFSTFKFIR